MIVNRKNEVSAIFDKDIVLQGILDQEQARIDSTQKSIATFISQELINEYLEYAKLKVHAEFKKHADFYKVGLEIVEKSSKECPFCGVSLNSDITTHIVEKHEIINKQIVTFSALNLKKVKFLDDLKKYKQVIEDYSSLLLEKTSNMADVNNEEDKAKIAVILQDEGLSAYEELIEIVDLICVARNNFSQNKKTVIKAIQEIEKSFERFHQSTEHITKLGEAIVAFISTGKELVQLIASKSDAASSIAEKLEKRLNILAGTQKLTVIISLLGKFEDINKYVRINQAIDSMKDLRAIVTEYVSEKTRVILEDQAYR